MIQLPDCFKDFQICRNHTSNHGVCDLWLVADNLNQLWSKTALRLQGLYLHFENANKHPITGFDPHLEDVNKKR